MCASCLNWLDNSIQFWNQTSWGWLSPTSVHCSVVSEENIFGTAYIEFQTDNGYQSDGKSLHDLTGQESLVRNIKKKRS
jgi:hypothetical protein